MQKYFFIIKNNEGNPLTKPHTQLNKRDKQKMQKETLDFYYLDEVKLQYPKNNILHPHGPSHYKNLQAKNHDLHYWSSSL